MNDKRFLEALNCAKKSISIICKYLWPPCVAEADIIFSCCIFFFLSIFFFRRLISAVADWMSTILPHMVWPYWKFRMQVWNVLHTARWKYKTQKIAKNSSCAHHRATFSGYVFATKTCIDNRKKTVKQQHLPHTSLQYVELRPSNGWDRFGCLGTPANFKGFRFLAALMHGTLVMGVSETLRCWTEGATYIRQGGHHVGHWPTF